MMQLPIIDYHPFTPLQLLSAHGLGFTAYNFYSVGAVSLPATLPPPAVWQRFQQKSSNQPIVRYLLSNKQLGRCCGVKNQETLKRLSHCW